MATPQSRITPKKHIYRRFIDCRVKLRFRENPPVGWVYDAVRMCNAFPRAAEQPSNLFLEGRYFKGMLAETLRYFKPELLREHRRVMSFTRVGDIRTLVSRLNLVRIRGVIHEQFPLGLTLEFHVIFPEEVFSLEEFQELLVRAGNDIGWAPLLSAEGYGRFIVLEISRVNQ